VKGEAFRCCATGLVGGSVAGGRDSEVGCCGRRLEGLLGVWSISSRFRLEVAAGTIENDATGLAKGYSRWAMELATDEGSGWLVGGGVGKCSATHCWTGSLEKTSIRTAMHWAGVGSGWRLVGAGTA
jgi:hypothetical protein